MSQMSNFANKSCLIEEQLSNVEASAHNKQQLTSFLFFLKNIISSLIENPLETKHYTLPKDSETSASALLNTKETRDLLLILGYSEEEDRFIYHISDENIIKLANCLRLLEEHIQSNGDAILCENLSLQARSSSSKSANTSFEEANTKEAAAVNSGRVKELYLSKQLKKEHSDMMRAGARKPKTSDFAFNNNGYFQQSSNNRDSRKNRNLMKELFHQNDHSTRGFSSGYSAKMI